MNKPLRKMQVNQITMMEINQGPQLHVLDFKQMAFVDNSRQFRMLIVIDKLASKLKNIINENKVIRFK